MRVCERERLREEERDREGEGEKGSIVWGGLTC